MKALVGLAVPVLALAACSTTSDEEAGSNPILEPILCTQEIWNGVTVEVRDAVSGAPAACGALGKLEDAGYSEALSDAGQCSRRESWLYLYGVAARAGTYRVTVEKPGYKTWVQEGVTVTFDGCHVQTVVVQASLEAL